MSLDERIEARKEEAREKDIEHKAEVIALGLGRTVDDYQGGEFHTHTYSDQEFFIEKSSGAAHDGGFGYGTEVKFLGEQVYHAGGGSVYCFKPGKWEVPFKRLYQKGKAGLKTRRAEEAAKKSLEEAKEEAEERRKWGL